MRGFAKRRRIIGSGYRTWSAAALIQQRTAIR